MLITTCFLLHSLTFIDGFGFNSPLSKTGFSFGFPGFSSWPSEGDVVGNVKQRFAKLLDQFGRQRPGLKTRVKNEDQDGAKVTTVTQDGKGYHSFTRFSRFNTNNHPSGGTKIKDKEPKKNKKSKRQCAGHIRCPRDQFCNPLLNICNKVQPEGATCQFKGQCGPEEYGIICVWGRCAKSIAGSLGTFCTRDNECMPDTYCTLHQSISPFYPMCTPKLDEGATCGQAHWDQVPGSFLNNLFGSKCDAEKPKKNYCRAGLKCAQVGWFGYYVCVPEGLKVTPYSCPDETEDATIQEAIDTEQPVTEELLEQEIEDKLPNGGQSSNKNGEHENGMKEISGPTIAEGPEQGINTGGQTDLDNPIKITIQNEDEANKEVSGPEENAGQDENKQPQGQQEISVDIGLTGQLQVGKPKQGQNEAGTTEKGPEENTEGENGQGENTEGENEEGENAESENTPSENTQGENAAAESAQPVETAPNENPQGEGGPGENEQSENTPSENTQGENASAEGVQSGETAPDEATESQNTPPEKSPSENAQGESVSTEGVQSGETAPDENTESQNTPPEKAPSENTEATTSAEEENEEKEPAEDEEEAGSTSPAELTKKKPLASNETNKVNPSESKEDSEETSTSGNEDSKETEEEKTESGEEGSTEEKPSTPQTKNESDEGKNEEEEEEAEESTVSTGEDANGQKIDKSKGGGSSGEEANVNISSVTVKPAPGQTINVHEDEGSAETSGKGTSKSKEKPYEGHRTGPESQTESGEEPSGQEEKEEEQYPKISTGSVPPASLGPRPPPQQPPPRKKQKYGPFRVTHQPSHNSGQAAQTSGQNQTSGQQTQTNVVLPQGTYVAPSGVKWPVTPQNKKVKKQRKLPNKNGWF